MKRVILSLVGTVGVGLLTVVPAWAHHAFAAEFDANRPVQVQGTIAKVEWTNPHVWFHIDVKNPNGEVERWMFEGGGPGSLVRRGFTKDYLKIGTEMVVQGYLAKGVARRANARVMTYTDGRTLFVGSSGTGAPEDGQDPSGKKQ
jgi:Family of unknown function (DUF6152)